MPSSTRAVPATLWPPPRTASGSPCSAAKRTAVATSSASAQRAIAAGRLSIMPFQTRRAVVVLVVVGRDDLAGQALGERGGEMAVAVGWMAMGAPLAGMCAACAAAVRRPSRLASGIRPARVRAG